MRPTLSRGLPLSSDGAARALGVGEGKKCARDWISVVAAAEMSLRESICSERGEGRTYLPGRKVGCRFSPLVAMEPWATHHFVDAR